MKVVFGAAQIVMVLSAFCAGPAHAVTNLIQNGNFATNDLTGWTQSGFFEGFPVVVAPLSPGDGNFPTDPISIGSPDPDVGYAAYFVDDGAVNQAISQTVYLAAGHYEIGFDVMAPANGLANPEDASFSGVIAGQTLFSADAHSLQASTWQHYSGTVDVLSAGNYTADFTFNVIGPDDGAADMMVNRVYIVATSDTGGTPIGGAAVPEPASLAILAAGLIGFGIRRKRTA